MKNLLADTICAIASVVFMIVWILLPDDDETKRRIELLEEEI